MAGSLYSSAEYNYQNAFRNPVYNVNLSNNNNNNNNNGLLIVFPIDGSSPTKFMK